MSEPRRRGHQWIGENAGVRVDWIESRPTDPADFDELIAAAKVLVASLDYHFAIQLASNQPYQRLRKALGSDNEQ